MSPSPGTSKLVFAAPDTRGYDVKVALHARQTATHTHTSRFYRPGVVTYMNKNQQELFMHTTRTYRSASLRRESYSTVALRRTRSKTCGDSPGAGATAAEEGDLMLNRTVVKANFEQKSTHQ